MSQTISIEPHAFLGVDTVEAARIGLLAMMAGISEDNWRASWLTGL